MVPPNPESGPPDAGSAAEIEVLCRELTAAHNLREDCRLRLRMAEEDFDRIEQELARRLEATGTQDLRYERWVLAPKRTVAWRTPEDRRDDVLKLLKAGVPDLVRESVNSSSLNAYLRREEERLEIESPPWWRGLSSILTRTESLGLSMRKR